MNLLYREIKKVIKYSDPVLLIGLVSFLSVGIWFLYSGISGLLK